MSNYSTECECKKQPELILLNIAYPVCGVVVLTNIAFIVALLNEKNFSRPINVLLLSDTFATLLFGGALAPLRNSYYIKKDCFDGGRTICQVILALDLHLSIVSLAHIAVISVERYVRVFCPHLAEDKRKRKITVLAVALCWTLPAVEYLKVFLLRPEMITQSFGGLECTSACTLLVSSPCNCVICFPDWTAAVTFSTVILLCIITFCAYGRIITVSVLRLKSTRAKTTSGSDEQTSKSLLILLIKSREFRTIRIFVGIFLAQLFCYYTPEIVAYTSFFASKASTVICDDPSIYNCQFPSASICHGLYQHREDQIFSLLLWWLSCVINPFILFVLGDKYRQNLKRDVDRLKQWCLPKTMGKNATTELWHGEL